MSTGWIIFTTCCCSSFLLFGLFLLGFIISIAKSKKDKFAPNDYLKGIWNWAKVITGRAIMSYLASAILLGIAEIAEEVSLFATMSLFIFFLTTIFIVIAFLFKIYITLSQAISPKREIAKSKISRTLITENEESTLTIGTKTGIPPGYVLKIQEKMPEKLGGDLRGLATKTENGKTSFETTIPITRRGVYSIGPANYKYQDLFGFSEVNFSDNSRYELTILPEVPRINRFNFKLSATKGDIDQPIVSLINTEDYFKTRKYVRGDDMRRMHWKLTAKTDEFVVREPEITTINFNHLTIAILNTQPRYIPKDSKSNMSHMIPYLTAAEYALDIQIKIAAALIDFAHRCHIPVRIYYYDKKELKHFEPIMDHPETWKRKLAEIDLQKATPDLDSLVKLIRNSNQAVLTTSELDPKVLGQITAGAKKYSSNIEIMYVPVSGQMQHLMEQEKPEKENKASSFLRFLKFVTLTKPYFEQTTLGEKLASLLSKVKPHYTEKKIDEVKDYENKIITFINSEGYASRVFQPLDMYSVETDYIVKTLEYD